MSQIAVETVPEVGVHGELEAFGNRVRRRAYEIFEGRGGGDGFALDDWLAAERELLGQRESEEIAPHAVTPGFDNGVLNETASTVGASAPASQTAAA